MYQTSYTKFNITLTIRFLIISDDPKNFPIIGIKNKAYSPQFKPKASIEIIQVEKMFPDGFEFGRHSSISIND